jgi:hypothetical protein
VLIVHSPAMEEWLWWLKFYSSAAALFGSFFGGMYWLLVAMIKKLDSRTEGIVRTVISGVVEAFNYEFQKRDDRFKSHEERFVSIEAQIVTMAIAGKALAVATMYPTNSHTRRERERLIDDWRKIIDQSEVDYKGDK